MRKNVMHKFVAIVTAAVILCIGAVSPIKVYAGSATVSMTLSKNASTIYNTAVEKSVTGTNASIHMYTIISVYDTVSVNLVDVNGKNAANSCSFRHTTGFATGSCPYLSGYGKAGDKYKVKASLSMNSGSSSLPIRLYVIP